MKAWGKIANALLWISIIVSSFGVFIGSVLLFNDENYGTGFTVLFGGAVVILLSHALIGVFLELCSNVAALKRKQYGESCDEDATVRKEWICSECGSVNEKDTVFCANCGRRNIKTEAK